MDEEFGWKAILQPGANLHPSCCRVWSCPAKVDFASARRTKSSQGVLHNKNMCEHVSSRNKQYGSCLMQCKQYSPTFRSLLATDQWHRTKAVGPGHSLAVHK